MRSYDPLVAKTKVALGVAVAFLCGLGLASQFGFTEAAPETAPFVETQAQVPVAAVRPAMELSDAFVAIAGAVTPSVVRIETLRRQARQRLSMEDFFRFRGRPPQQDEQTVRTGGSGFVVSEDGYVMTNNHVVEDAQEITVALQDGRTFPAEVIGTDPTTDVAVIKIEADDLTPATLGSAAEVRVGEWVLAIGNPGLGSGGGGAGSLDYSVTAGIVSARGRNLNLIRRDLQTEPEFSQERAGFAIEDFIQTDAVINPGNSGGPMVNLRGQVVGINTAIASLTGYYQGYGFAIPINLAHRIMEDLVAYGRVRRAYLGISMQPVTPEDAEVYGLPEVAGAHVQQVVRDTPAEEAGLRRGDVITAVDGEPVRTSNDLQHKIALLAPGDRVRLTVYRDGDPREIAVRLGEAPLLDEPAEVAAAPARAAGKLGIQVADITPATAEVLQLESTEGAVVERVQEYGPASRRGIRRGCVIHEINREPVDDADDVDRLLRDVEPGDVVSLVAQCQQAQASVYNIRVPR